MFDSKEKKNLAVFSYGLSLIVSIFVLLHARKHGWMASSYLLLGVAFVSVLITMLRPGWLNPLYKRWMKVAYFISSIVTAICLSFIFYGVFMPIGILLRLLKKDLLARSLDKTVSSYWCRSDNPVTDIRRYTQQF